MGYKKEASEKCFSEVFLKKVMGLAAAQSKGAIPAGGGAVTLDRAALCLTGLAFDAETQRLPEAGKAGDQISPDAGEEVEEVDSQTPEGVVALA